jgi:hypothetical protein
MTPIIASSHLPTGEPRLRHCTFRPAVSDAISYIFDQAKIAPSTTAETTMMARRLPIRRQLRGQRVPYPNRCPVKSP